MPSKRKSAFTKVITNKSPKLPFHRKYVLKTYSEPCKQAQQIGFVTVYYHFKHCLYYLAIRFHFIWSHLLSQLNFYLYLFERRLKILWCNDLSLLALNLELLPIGIKLVIEWWFSMSFDTYGQYIWMGLFPDRINYFYEKRMILITVKAYGFRGHVFIAALFLFRDSIEKWVIVC